MINDILAKARKLKGLSLDDVSTLLNAQNPADLQKIYQTAKFVKSEIYGDRLVLFAPLYISNICFNECLYCAFRASNTSIKRCALSQKQIADEVKALLKQGHKRILMVAGESYSGAGLKYVFDSIDTIYSVKEAGQNIRRVNVNIAPLTTEEFRDLAKHNIGTFQLFQETYHQPTYERLHIAGPKADYHFRLSAMHRAMEAGISDVGIGVLFGLYDYKYEVLALLKHVKDLEDKFGIGPHTISVPRIEPADGSPLSERPPHQVSDEDFKKIVAVLRLAVPYTGLILSTRESAKMRSELLELGISQVSAGSKTNPGGYEDDSAGQPDASGEQFSLGDHRTMPQVIDDILDHGHIPSFCTGCYRLGRVGKDFMDLAKPGLIKAHCLPNAIFSFAEYLLDFADKALQQKGFNAIEKATLQLPPAQQDLIRQKLAEIKEGKRDIYL